jgi:hypothetical protein
MKNTKDRQVNSEVRMTLHDAVDMWHELSPEHSALVLLSFGNHKQRTFEVDCDMVGREEDVWYALYTSMVEDPCFANCVIAAVKAYDVHRNLQKH